MGNKLEQLVEWIKSTWTIPKVGQDWIFIWAGSACTNQRVLDKFTADMPDDWRYVSCTMLICPLVVHINSVDYEGMIGDRSGAFQFRFEKGTGDEAEVVEVILIAAYEPDDYSYDLLTVAFIPREFTTVWGAFERGCWQLRTSLEPTEKVVIIGGKKHSFVPTVEWDDIVLPASLKADLMNDVQSFFTSGIEIYKGLKLKPFRKLLLAGVPGTGKTMLCSAFAKWAIERDYLVIYISSADRRGATFGKIEEALTVAANSKVPTLILLEELDAYLSDDERALVLNVLDGAESSMNDQGSLIIATTNYPEVIDDRVLKRPGRLDRVYIIPETRTLEDASEILRKYLGTMWQDDHRGVAEKLIGYPGAFIREVAIHALTQVAFAGMAGVPLDTLSHSFTRLKEQIDARDDFLSKRIPVGWGREG